MTIRELNAIKRLNAEGKSDQQIAEELGMKASQVRQARYYYKLPFNKAEREPFRYYTVWNAKTDELVADGTAAECAAIMGRSRTDFYTMVSRVKRGINKKYVVLVENYDD